MSAISKIKISNEDYQIIGSPRYAICDTEEYVAAKEAVWVTRGSTLILEPGVRVSVKFINANMADSPTLNIGNTGAVSIYWNNEPLSFKQYWQANSIVDFVYNGLVWELVNTTYNATDGISLSGTTFSNSGVRSIATGFENGTIAVNTNGVLDYVGVKGLKSAAYTSSNEYDVAGDAEIKAYNALESAKKYANAINNELGLEMDNKIAQKTQVQIITWGVDD